MNIPKKLCRPNIPNEFVMEGLSDKLKPGWYLVFCDADDTDLCCVAWEDIIGVKRDEGDTWWIECLHSKTGGHVGYSILGGHRIIEIK
jgi:hypothetical protein